MISPRVLASALLLGLLAPSAVSAQNNGGSNNLIINGGFEIPAIAYHSYHIYSDGSVTGWTDTTSCGIEVQNQVSGSPFQGNQFLEVMSNCDSDVYQMVPTVVGSTYTLSFSWSLRPHVNHNDVVVYFDDTVVDTLSGDGTSLADTHWTTKQYNFVAQHALTKIRFQGKNPVGSDQTSGGYFDNVILTTAAQADHTPPSITGGTYFPFHIAPSETNYYFHLPDHLQVTDNVELSSEGLICTGQPIGSLYPLGTTHVQCTASDVSGNEATIDVIIFVTHGSIVGDPQFTGFNGQSYQVHGVPNTVYNIISTPQFQFNALFSFLDSGKCRVGTPCFSHPGNYFGAVGLMMKDANQIHEMVIQSGEVDTGLTVTINNQTLSTPATFQAGSYLVEVINPFEVVVSGGEFDLRFQNSDHFLNQDVSIGVGLLKQITQYKRALKTNDKDAEALAATLPHGVLGQTWDVKQYANRWKYIQGQLNEYQVMDGLLGKEFTYNRF